MTGTRRFARQAVIAYNVAVGPAAAIAAIAAGNPLWAIPAILAGHAPWMYATLVPHCAWFGDVVTEVSGHSKRSVWLTIDDGPDPNDTPVLLDILDEFEARATFFFVGDRAAKHRELVREVIQRGHQVGNHTMSHPHFRFWAFGPRAARREICDCRAELETISGRPVALFRAPAGLKNPFVQSVLEREGIDLIGWSARGLDGIRTNRAAILDALRASIRPGAIVLVHEGRTDENGQRLAPDVLRGTLEYIRDAGLHATLPADNP